MGWTPNFRINQAQREIGFSTQGVVLSRKKKARDTRGGKRDGTEKIAHPHSCEEKTPTKKPGAGVCVATHTPRGGKLF